MKNKIIIAALILGTGIALTGCATKKSLDEENEKYSSVDREVEELEAGANTNPFQLNPKVQRTKGFYLSSKPRKEVDHAWLRSIPYSSTKIDSISGKEVLRSFSREGINITSAVPLGDYTYSGYRIEKTNALNALRIMLWSMGLDFKVDDEERLVTILPMSSHTYSLNLPHRISAFAVGDELEADDASSGGEGEDETSSIPKLIQGNGLAVSNDFWGNLEAEIKGRCKQMMPIVKDSGVSEQSMSRLQQSSSGSGDEDKLYKSVSVCQLTINPTTGSVSIQAPHWLRADFDAYFEKLQNEVNASLVFEGRLILVSSTEEESRGLDLRSFVEFASEEYGLFFSNNALGGVSFTPSGAIPGDAIAGPMLGVVDNDGLSRIFNGYLSSLGKVSIVQKPLIRTTSGVAGEFIRASEVYYTTVNQNAVADDNGAQVATSNELQTKETGTFFRIFPTYDGETGLVRSQMSLQHKLQTGSAKQNYYLSSGGSTQAITVEIPIVSTIDYSGELVMEDGETIIVGGQVENNGQYSDEGITKLKDSFLGGLFGFSNESEKVLTYYIVLTAKVVKHDRRS